MATIATPLRRLPLFRRDALSQPLQKISNTVSASQPRRWMSVISLSDSNAVEKFRSIHSKSVLYFTASWCPPCKMIAPIYDTLSKQYPSVAFGKIDVDNNQDSAAEFQISAVPTFVFSKGKEAVNKFSGADKVQLEKFVKEL